MAGRFTRAPARLRPGGAFAPELARNDDPRWRRSRCPPASIRRQEKPRGNVGREASELRPVRLDPPRWDCVYLTPRRPGEASESRSIKVCSATSPGNCDEQRGDAPAISLRLPPSPARPRGVCPGPFAGAGAGAEAEIGPGSPFASRQGGYWGTDAGEEGCTGGWLPRRRRNRFEPGSEKDGRRHDIPDAWPVPGPCTGCPGTAYGSPGRP